MRTSALRLCRWMAIGVGAALASTGGCAFPENLPTAATTTTELDGWWWLEWEDGSDQACLEIEGGRVVAWSLGCYDALDGVFAGHAAAVSGDRVIWEFTSISYAGSASSIIPYGIPPLARYVLDLTLLEDGTFAGTLVTTGRNDTEIETKVRMTSDGGDW